MIELQEAYDESEGRNEQHGLPALGVHIFGKERSIGTR